MPASGSECVFNGNTISRYNNMYFETIEISPLGSIVTSIFLSFDDATVRDTNVMANSYRKTVDTVGVAYIQRFDGFSCMEEKFSQLAYAIGVDPDSKDIYISDTDYQTNDKVYIFSSAGVLKKTVDAGIMACKFVFN
jgi:DNA-binding beta-propeller fold protein YncE